MGVPKMNIELKGSCTIQRSEELLEMLREAVAGEADTVAVSFAAIEDADLSFFQLIEALRRSCQTMGKKLVLQKDLPAELASRAQYTGFAEITMMGGVAEPQQIAS